MWATEINTTRNAMEGDTMTTRTLTTIAQEIRADWKPVNYAAKPYLDAMSTLNSISDKFYFDSGHSVVAYFLGNARAWKGETAKRVKAELNSMLKGAR